MNLQCNFCRSILSSKSALNHHQRTNKKCLLLSGVTPKEKINNEQNIIIIDLQKKLLELEAKYNMIFDEKKVLKQDYDNLLDKITTSAISKTTL